jgi:hypothetical protein
MQDQNSSDQPQIQLAPSAESPKSDPVLIEALSAIRQRQLAIGSHLRLNRRRLHKALKRLGATSVVVSYSGSGDSGQIDEVSVYRNKEQIKSQENVSILVASSKWSEDDGWIERVKSTPLALEAALEQFVYDWIESEHSGWENNDGASGECTIEVASNEFILSHVTYYTESESTEHVL